VSYVTVRWRLVILLATLMMLWATAAADWPFDLIPGWGHG
jgi:hypothetical protein